MIKRSKYLILILNKGCGSEKGFDAFVDGTFLRSEDFLRSRSRAIFLTQILFFKISEHFFIGWDFCSRWVFDDKGEVLGDLGGTFKDYVFTFAEPLFMISHSPFKKIKISDDFFSIKIKISPRALFYFSPILYQNQPQEKTSNPNNSNTTTLTPLKTL